MHMNDALLSLPVAAGCWALTAGTLAVAARRCADDPRATPARMGALGAFVFAAQMINFAIPGTGSSGHFAGGTLLALLLGPWAATLVMASVLAVQALFFADGGLLAWGANVMNMGLFAAFVALPWVYRSLAPEGASPARRRTAVIAASMAACIGGAVGVTLQTTASGITELPFRQFLLLMVPLHAAIGIGEGLISAALLERLGAWQSATPLQPAAERRALLGIGLAVLLTAGALSWFASARPDGLEYSVARLGAEPQPRGLGAALSAWQAEQAPLPDYDFKAASEAPEAEAPWPAVNAGTSSAGLLGALLVALSALSLGWLASRLHRPTAGV